jgi:hypothetical protein
MRVEIGLQLVPDLSGGQDPDDSFSKVPYEKGFYFLTYLQTVSEYSWAHPGGDSPPPPPPSPRPPRLARSRKATKNTLGGWGLLGESSDDLDKREGR